MKKNGFELNVLKEEQCKQIMETVYKVLANVG